MITPNARSLLIYIVYTYSPSRICIAWREWNFAVSISQGYCPPTMIPDGVNVGSSVRCWLYSMLRAGSYQFVILFIFQSTFREINSKRWPILNCSIVAPGKIVNGRSTIFLSRTGVTYFFLWSFLTSSGARNTNQTINDFLTQTRSPAGLIFNWK